MALGASDYEDDVAAASSADKLPLAGTPGTTPWDPQLAVNMSRIGVAVHEEALLNVLLADLSRRRPASVAVPLSKPRPGG